MPKKKTLEEVKKYFESFGWQVLDSVYVNSSTKLNVICDKEHAIKISYNKFYIGRRCKPCDIKARTLEFEDVKKHFAYFNYTLLDTVYRHCQDKLNVVCSNGHKIKIRYHDFKNDHRCKKCHFESVSGENSPHWNPDLTDKERKARRDIDNHKLSQWRKSIFERDDYTCQKCFRKGGKLEAHHIFNWAYYPDLRYNLENGITLCSTDHDKLHSLYGYRTTKNHLEDFLSEEKYLERIRELARKSTMQVPKV